MSRLVHWCAALLLTLAAGVGCSAESPSADQPTLGRATTTASEAPSASSEPIQRQFPPTSAPVAPAPPPEPLRIAIAAIDLDLAVVPVGIAVDNQMALPSRLDEAGWYRFGPAPGADHGSAVIAGHVDSRRFGVGPLARLRDARPGDAVVVSRNDGSAIRFVIDQVEVVSKSELDLGEMFRREGSPVLRILTCGGGYSSTAGGYLDNVIVTAIQVPST